MNAYTLTDSEEKAVSTILDEALAAVDGDRRDDYGTVGESFENMAMMWSVLLGKNILSADVARCMIAMKLCRDIYKGKRDNRIDIAGYAHCLQTVDPAD
jgi:hypothetical protein